MPYLYSNNGLTYRWVDVSEKVKPQPGEALFDDLQSDAVLAKTFPDMTAAQVKKDALMAIMALEAQQTTRRLREAVLGTDGGWLAKSNQQILELRAKL